MSPDFGRKLLARAVPEVMDPVYRVKKLMAHGFQDSQAFVYSGWRFIIAETDNGKILKTIERVNPTQN